MSEIRTEDAGKERRRREAAARALAEAQARRQAKERDAGERPAERPVEHGGPKGPEPTRFGDWERKGIASDF